MRVELLPLFPLPLVLFPRTPLPLHIFEDRYKEMIGEAIEGHSEFGVVLSKDQGIVNMGCTATVEDVSHRYPDGRLDIVTRGRRRFELLELVEGKSYLRGKVTYFDDDEFDPVTEDLRRRAVEGYGMARQATGEDVSEPEWNDPQLSFQLAQIFSDVDLRQQLLVTRSETERLKQFVQHLPTHVLRVRHSEQIREVAPKNGKAKHIPFLN